MDKRFERYNGLLVLLFTLLLLLPLGAQVLEDSTENGERIIGEQEFVSGTSVSQAN